MMRIVCLLTVLILVLLSPIVAIGNRTGAPVGHTGAPAVGGRNCTACHSGTANSGPGAVSIQVPAPNFRAGSVIPVTVRLGGTLQNPGVNGFQVAAYPSGSSTPLGGWTPAGSGIAQVIANHVTHTSSGVGRTSWTAYLPAPGAATTLFTIYAAGNDANGNFLNSGDRIYTTSASQQAGTVNLSLSGAASLPVTGATAQLDLDAPGDAGKFFVLAASFGASGVNIGGRPVPLAVDALLLVTAQNVLPQVFQGYQGTLNGSGRASAQLRVPASASLKGIVLHHAFVVLDPQRPQGIGTISNGLPLTIL